MTPIFNPLRDKAELLNTHAQPYQHAFDQIADTITFADLAPCPICNSDNDIDYIQTANEPEHGTYGIAIGCIGCEIQTAGQHWFISSPHSALSALNTAIELWNRRPEQAISEDAEVIKAAETVIASEARQSESRDKFNPASDTLSFDGMQIPPNLGEPCTITGDWGENNPVSMTGYFVLPELYREIQQDAARYQEIKRILHSWHISFAFLKGKPDHLVIDLSIAGKVIATDNNELTGLDIDLDKTIDNSIAATQQPEAAK